MNIPAEMQGAYMGSMTWSLIIIGSGIILLILILLGLRKRKEMSEK